jgi:hypothetical protein
MVMRHNANKISMMRDIEIPSSDGFPFNRDEWFVLTIKDDVNNHEKKTRYSQRDLLHVFFPIDKVVENADDDDDEGCQRCGGS